MTTLQTMRIPRGLWADLEETVIHQDRQFLTEVARSLGLPVAEVLKKCLVPEKVACLVGEPTEERCPWWYRSADGMWRPCGRLRLTPDGPCQTHQHAKAGPLTCLAPDLADLPTLHPVSYEGLIYWVSDDPDAYTYREDGTISALEFKYIEHRGSRILVCKSA